MDFNDLLTKLEETNDLEFYYRDRFQKFDMKMADMNCQQQIIENIASNFSLNQDIDYEKELDLPKSDNVSDNGIPYVS